MVATYKNAEKLAFSKLLNAELDRIGVPNDRTRIREVWQRLKLKGVPLVSREQVRKWLKGIDIPDQTNLRLTVQRLNLVWTNLQPGAAPSPIGEPQFQELLEVWERLDADARQDVVDLAIHVRDKFEKKKNTTARVEGKDAETGRTLRRS